MSSATRNPLLKAARNPSRSIAAPTLPIRHLVIHKPTKGFDTSLIQHQPFANHNQPAPDVAQTPPVQSPAMVTSLDRDLYHMDVDPAVAPSNVGSISVTTTSNTIMRTLIDHRVRADVARAQPVAKKRKRRTCAKCARNECSGSQKSSNCRNPCQDCKQTTCRGRNARKPKKPCNTPGLWDR